MATESHLRRPWQTLCELPRDYQPAAEAAVHALQAAAYGDSLELSRLSPQLSLLPERAPELCPTSPAASLAVPAQSPGPNTAF